MTCNSAPSISACFLNLKLINTNNHTATFAALIYSSANLKAIGATNTLVRSFWVYGEYHFVSLTLPCRLISNTKWICKTYHVKIFLYVSNIRNSSHLHPNGYIFRYVAVLQSHAKFPGRKQKIKETGRYPVIFRSVPWAKSTLLQSREFWWFTSSLAHVIWTPSRKKILLNAFQPNLGITNIYFLLDCTITRRLCNNH